MAMRRKKSSNKIPKSILFKSILLISLDLLTIPFVIDIYNVLFNPKHCTVSYQLEIYKWAAIGFVSYLFFYAFFKKNVRFLETFSHELTHTIYAFVFGREIHSFMASNGAGGRIKHSGRFNPFQTTISLSPYCVPIFTFFLLSFRWMLHVEFMWIYDILVGMTICFHIICFKNQTGSFQTDITKFPVWFSYTYIASMWLINTCLILTSFFPNMNGQGRGQSVCEYGFWSCIWRLFNEWKDALVDLYNWLSGLIIPLIQGFIS